MKCIKISTVWLLLISGCLIHNYANSQDYMRIHLNDGSTIEIAIDEIQKLTFGITTGLAHESKIVAQALQLNIFPNPANNYINIEYQPLVAGMITIDIFNVEGKCVHSNSVLHESQGKFKYLWNTHDVPGGTYICKIRSGNEVIANKLIIKK